MGCVAWCRVEGVADVGSYGSNLMQEGGSSVGMVCGHDWLVPGIALLVAGGRGSLGASSVV